jgi:hypothetical protein
MTVRPFKVNVDGTVFIVMATSMFHAFSIARATYPIAVVITDA